MILRIDAGDVPRKTVEKLLEAARERTSQQTLTPDLTDEHKGSYYVVVDHPDVAKCFTGALSAMNVKHEEVSELPAEVFVRQRITSGFKTIASGIGHLLRKV